MPYHIAVCYQEAAPEQFEAYCEELQDTTTTDVKDMLQQIKTINPPSSKNSEANVRFSSWQ